MLNIGCLQHRHACCYTHTIIGTQGGSSGGYPFTVHIGIDWVLFKIVLGIGIFLWYHIHVALKDDTFSVFHTFSCGFFNDHIADLIDDGFQIKIFTEFLQVSDYFFFFLRGPRYLC